MGFDTEATAAALSSKVTSSFVHREKPSLTQVKMPYFMKLFAPLHVNNSRVEIMFEANFHEFSDKSHKSTNVP